MIQAVLDATAADGVCVLPGGTIDVPQHTQFTVPRPMTVDGNGTVIRVVDGSGNLSTVPPTAHLFQASSLPNGSRFEVRDLTIHGPDCTGWDPQLNNNRAAINYVQGNTHQSTVVLDNVTITGGYGYGLQRSGGGELRIHRSSLSGWVGGYAFFESHGKPGHLVCTDTTLDAPAVSKWDSIGAYITPSMRVTWNNVTGSDWNRYLCYLNGSMQAAVKHRLSSVEAHGCSLVQTGVLSEAALVGCAEYGPVRNGGSYLMGPVRSTGCTWAGGVIGLRSNDNVHRCFFGDTITKASTWLAAGANTTGTVKLVECQVKGGVRTNPASTVAVTLQSCTIDDPGAGNYTLNLEGGSARLVDTPTPSRVRVVAPGVLH